MPKTYTNRKLSSRYPTDLNAWQGLKSHYADMKKRTLAQLFARDADRAERFCIDVGDLTLDYSKNHVNATTCKLFARLAREAGVPAAIEAMFAGETINETEDRAVLHAALRKLLMSKGMPTYIAHVRDEYRSCFARDHMIIIAETEPLRHDRIDVPECQQTRNGHRNRVRQRHDDHAAV